MSQWSEQFESIIRSHLLASNAKVTLTPKTTFSDLELDSLTIMSLLTALENGFSKMLPEHALESGLDTTLAGLWSHFRGAQPFTDGA